VTNSDQRASLVKELRDVPIDILINNAGVYGQRKADFGETDEIRWVETFAVNVIAPMQLCEALVENVTSSRRKVIASISSQVGSIEDNSSGGHLCLPFLQGRVKRGYEKHGDRSRRARHHGGDPASGLG